jgi:hypothetical protein
MSRARTPSTASARLRSEGSMAPSDQYRRRTRSPSRSTTTSPAPTLRTPCTSVYGSATLPKVSSASRPSSSSSRAAKPPSKRAPTSLANAKRAPSWT